VGFGVWGVGCEVWGLGSGVWCLGSRVWSLGSGVWGVGFGVWGLGCGVCTTEGRGSTWGNPCTCREQQTGSRLRHPHLHPPRLPSIVKSKG
jgi:hypothetical protein